MQNETQDYNKRIRYNKSVNEGRMFYYLSSIYNSTFKPAFLAAAVHVSQFFSMPTYQSYKDALDAITAIARQRHIVFVIDEYPYLAKAKRSISSRLQHIIDHVWQNTGFSAAIR